MASGTPGKPGLKITQPGVGSSDVDVFGGAGEYIAVGGPKKTENLAKLGQKLNILKYAAGPPRRSCRTSDSQPLVSGLRLP